jgi:alcohol dehydrogenase (NADP+)
MEKEFIINGWAAFKEKDNLKPFSYKARPLGDYDIDVKITHCGICHSDIHYIDNGWKSSTYPGIPGHEIIGNVISIGPKVKDFKIGDRVGVGPQCLSCFSCESCEKGEETMCKKRVFTYNGTDYTGNTTYGGYANGIRVDSRWAFKIPDNLPSEKAAPLLCAGLTVYTPFIYYQLKPGAHVGILSIGGLGHLAIQFARALGFKVTCISSTKDKELESKNLGAHEFIYSKDEEKMKNAESSMDFILCCSSANLEWSKYFNLLKPNGKLCLVGVPEEPLGINAGDIIFWRKSLVGSIVGDTRMTRDMLKLCSEKNIVAWVSTAPLSKVNETIEKVRKGQARYRFVLETDK